jgi:FkbM family methyltransferase
MRDGSSIQLRAGTTDSKVFEEIFADRIYAAWAAACPERPQVLVDLGANIGLSTLFLDREMGFERVIAVEPDFENVRALRNNLEGNVHAELTILHAFAGEQRGFANVLDAGYGAWGLRMGDVAEAGVPVIPLEEIVPDAPGGVLLKCDIEGGERFVFPNIAAWDERVSFIILELHMEFFTLAQLEAALASSKYAWRVHGSVEVGAVLAVLALERGVLKTVHSKSDSRDHSCRSAAV